MVKKATLLAALTVGLLVLPAAPALAIHCAVADKPPGAGTASPSEWKVAGSTGDVVIPGAFVNLSEIFPGAPNQDVFVRGPEAKEIGEEEIGTVGRSFGSLPQEAHENGPPDHGVVEIPFGP
jgi:hypothetical protein